uniref:Uncharacterized protein n=2 Tax=Vitis vinifera TaxID=29760 RepID=A5BNN8_VITVI|nr:hypothetical protein VITISV_041690 [Vitis vinifera]
MNLKYCFFLLFLQLLEWEVSLSSLNRHAVATREDVGIPKAQCLKKHFSAIFPECQIDARVLLYDASSEEDILSGHPDFVLDCIDNIDTKGSLRSKRDSISGEVDMATKNPIFTSVISGSLTITSKKLIGSENYLSWSAFVELWFMGQGYEDHLVTPEDAIPDVDKVQWKKIDAQLCSVLWQFVDPKILHHLRAYKTCFKFWTQSKGLYTNDIQRFYKVVSDIVHEEFLTLMPFTNGAEAQQIQADKFFMVLTLIGFRPDLESVRDQILASPSVPSLDDCTYCNKLGHTRDRCYQLHGRPPRTAHIAQSSNPLLSRLDSTASSTSQSITLIGSDYDAYLRYQAATSTFVASVAQTDNVSVCFTQSSSLGPWILDSGASDHISGNKHLFSSITTTSALPTVTLANGSQTMAKGIRREINLNSPETLDEAYHKALEIGILVALLAACVRRGLKVLSATGAGARADPTRIRVADLRESTNDPLSRSKYCLFIFCRHLSLFKIPVSIASKIEKMQRDFLWSGAGEGKRDHLIRWEVVSRPREMGGLGFGKTSMRNSALLGKWLWRFPRERSGLWHKVIASIYGTHPNGWDANMVVRWSHRCPWKAIAQVFQEFSPFVRLVVGNGERIRFWEDLWWGNQTLCAQFADLYRVISVRNLTVSNVLGNSFPLSWNFNFCRNLTDSEIDLLQRLMSSIHSVLLSPSSSDSRAWSLSSSGSFSVKSFFYALSRDSNPLMFLPAKFLWSSKVPSKVKALAWLVAHGKVNTNDKLQLRRPYKALCPQWCILCKGNGESIDHLFLHCPVTIGLWHRLFNLVGVIWVPPRSIEDMLVISFKGLGNSVRGKILWQIACLTLIWMVWQERNNRIFEDKGRTEEVVWDLIRFYSSLWASCTEAFRGVPLSILQINWIGVCVSRV